MVDLSPRQSNVWSETGVAYSPGEEVYRAGEQPIAEVDNRAMWEITSDIQTLFSEVEGHTHDGRYYTKSQIDSQFTSSSHDHDDRYYTMSQSNGRFVNASGDQMSGDLALPTLRTRTSQAIVLEGVSNSTNWLLNETSSGPEFIPSTNVDDSSQFNQNWGLGISTEGLEVRGIHQTVTIGAGTMGGPHTLAFGTSDHPEGVNLTYRTAPNQLNIETSDTEEKIMSANYDDLSIDFRGASTVQVPVYQSDPGSLGPGSIYIIE